jgi:prevent-host-death family protein
MTKVNMLEAKTNLSKLVEAVETGKETEIILARNGKPVARIVPIELEPRKLGLAEGMFDDSGIDWYADIEAQGEAAQAILDARWERFERHSRELDEAHEKRKRDGLE